MKVNRKSKKLLRILELHRKLQEDRNEFDMRKSLFELDCDIYSKKMREFDNKIDELFERSLPKSLSDYTPCVEFCNVFSLPLKFKFNTIMTRLKCVEKRLTEYDTKSDYPLKISRLEGDIKRSEIKHKEELKQMQDKIDKLVEQKLLYQSRIINN